MQSLLDDFLFGIRLIRRRPYVAAVAIFCLSAGIGLSTAMFSLTYSIIGRGLPFEDQERIIHVMRRDITQQSSPTTPIYLDDFRYLREHQTSFENLTAIAPDGITVGLAGHPRFRSAAYVTPNFFEVLPTQAAMGRLFSPEDGMPSAESVLILSDRVWRDQFAAAPDIIGKACVCEGQPYTIVGVLPPEYDYPFGGTEVWMPLIPETLVAQTGWINTVTLIGRLNEDRSLEDARSEADVLFLQIDEMKGETDQAHVVPNLRPMNELFIGKEVKILMWTMFGATFLVLLIACSNVSSLLQARLVARTNELAIRSALGANRKRIISQVLGETFVWALIGTCIGLVCSFFALRFLWNFVSQQVFSPPSFMEFRMDPVSVLVAVGLMIVAVFFAGFFPALRASRPNIGVLLNDSTRTGSSLRLSRFSSLSTITQLAMSLALLVAAGRLIVAIIEAGTIEYPFDGKNLLVGSLSVDSQTYPEDEDQVKFWEELHRNLKTIPGASSVSIGFNMPAVFGMTDPIRIEGESYASEDDYPFVRFNVVTPGYFETLGVSLLQGRDFEEADKRGNEPVAIVNTVMAEKFWPDESPLGKIFYVQGSSILDEANRAHRVIGVAPDLKMDGLFNEEDDGAGFYRSQGQSLWGDQKIFVRSEMEPGSLIPQIQRAINTLDPNIALTQAKTFENHVHDTFFYFRFFIGLFSTFGAMALVLCSAGIYGIIQFSVNQRVTEIGIRMAIGAKPSDIKWMIIRKGMVNAVIGLFVGTILSFFLTKGLMIAFQGLEVEYLSLGAAIFILLMVALVANSIPARRAARLDAMSALRTQ
ncbi:ABC transporter permease [Puniceicoccales bacterium CK1056]|uniref:ABC transporter permease n=1 Tax=Oceanipulchritudo coccoides TaxID=2706888 RepID=A0A6B2LY23_9BACT|nr:ABC transporter permease [Oceanipulchritudo coccoides]NDV61233.1 ABC transporter permease [Oceanipulchritudo coccoides]